MAPVAILQSVLRRKTKTTHPSASEQCSPCPFSHLQLLPVSICLLGKVKTSRQLCTSRHPLAALNLSGYIPGSWALNAALQLFQITMAFWVLYTKCFLWEYLRAEINPHLICPWFSSCNLILWLQNRDDIVLYFLSWKCAVFRKISVVWLFISERNYFVLSKSKRKNKLPTRKQEYNFFLMKKLKRQHKIWTIITHLCYTYLLNHILFFSDTFLEKWLIRQRL